MILKNPFPKGRFFTVKVEGIPQRVWIDAYGQYDLSNISNKFAGDALIGQSKRLSATGGNRASYVFFRGNNYSLVKNIERGKIYYDKNSRKLIESDFVENPSSGGDATSATYFDVLYGIQNVVTGSSLTTITLISGEGDVSSNLTGKDIALNSWQGFYYRTTNNFAVQNPTFDGSNTVFEIDSNVGSYPISHHVSPNGYIGLGSTSNVIEGTIYSTTITETFGSFSFSLVFIEDLTSIFSQGDIVKIVNNGITIYDIIATVSTYRFGEMAVSLRLGLNLNFSGAATIQLITPLAAPVADFSANATQVTAEDTVTFTDSSTYEPTSWNWSFTGGTPSTSTEQNPTVVFSGAAGSYSVSLTATNAYGTNTETKADYIEVIELGPNLVVNGDFEAADPLIAWSVGDGILTNSTSDPAPYEGNQCGKLVRTYVSADGDKRSQDIIVEHGATYKIECAQYMEFAPSKFSSAYLQVIQGGTLFNLSPAATLNVWQNLSDTFVTSTSALTISLRTDSASSNSCVYFDAVKLRKVL